MASRLDVKALASKVASMILAGSEAPELQWVSEIRVRVLTQVVIPMGKQNTTVSQRRRFASALEQILAAQGWNKVAAGTHTVFEKNPTLRDSYQTVRHGVVA